MTKPFLNFDLSDGGAKYFDKFQKTDEIADGSTFTSIEDQGFC